MFLPYNTETNYFVFSRGAELRQVVVFVADFDGYLAVSVTAGGGALHHSGERCAGWGGG